MPRPVKINNIVIYNRPVGKDPLSYADIVVFDNNNRLENRRTCYVLPDMATTLKIEVTCSIPLFGQGLEIGKDKGIITLAEVEE